MSDPPIAVTLGSTRALVEVVTTSGRAAALEFRIRADTVEVWHHQHLAAVLDRRVLADWLQEPTTSLIVDKMQLEIDWQVNVRGRVAVTLPNVSAWTLSPTELDTLYRRVVIDLRTEDSMTLARAAWGLGASCPVGR